MKTKIKLPISTKGVSPIIAIILLLMMTIAIGGLAYTFIQRFQSGVATSTENQSARQSQILKVRLEIDGYNTTCGAASSWLYVRINGRNAGVEPTNHVQLYVDNQIINGASNTTLAAGQATSFLLPTNESCSNWVNKTKVIGLRSDESSTERSFTISCTTGGC